MSRATKRKHVMHEIQQDVLEPPSGNQQITKVVASRGNNLHEVETGEGEKFLVTMPTKYRRNVWIKRGDYVLVEPITEGLKVKAEIIKILTKDHEKYYKSCDVWPQNFYKATDSALTNNTNDGGLVRNTNRLINEDEDSTSEESDSETDSD